jgi:hypothetical protein
MWLPVMDYKNNAVENPNARQVSDTKMRCLVKCLAMFGLGHYIYGGEDLPTSDDTKEDKPVKEEVKKEEPKEEPKAEPEEDKHQPKDEDWAKAKIEGMKNIGKGLANEKEIKSLWKANIEDMAYIKENFKGLHDELAKHFAELVAQLKQGEE